MHATPKYDRNARDLLRSHRVTGPPVPVEDMARQERIDVVRAPADGSERAFLLREAQRTVIGLSSRAPRPRQRVLLAHVLGHYRLHKARPLIVDHTIRVPDRAETPSAASDNEETEANRFAAALLTPRDWVHEAVDQQQRQGDFGGKKGLTLSLANQFDVTTEAMLFRLVDLGVFTG